MGLLDKAKSLGSKTVEESKKYAEVTKLNIAISTYEEQIKECKSVIGGIVAEHGLPVPADNAAVLEQLAKINELRQKIEETRNKINEVKNVNICDSCGAEVPVGEKFCSKCGAPAKKLNEVLQADSGKKCPNCGTTLEPDMAFCSNCGQAL